MKIAPGLMALALVLAACGSGDDDSSDESGTETTVAVATDETAEDTTEDAADTEAADDAAATDDAADAADGEDEAMEDDAMEDDADDDAMEDDATDTSDDAADDTDDGVANDPAAADGELGPVLASVLAQTGIEPTPEVVGCIEDRGIDLSLGADANEDAVAETTLALFACAPEPLAEVIAADTPAPPGTDADDVTCVITETFRYLGELPPEEALDALDAGDMPPEIQSALTPIVTDVCDIDEDQAAAIFDS